MKLLAYEYPVWR